MSNAYIDTSIRICSIQGFILPRFGWVNKKKGSSTALNDSICLGGANHKDNTCRCHFLLN